jgi:hypothetical protein
MKRKDVKALRMKNARKTVQRCFENVHREYCKEITKFMGRTFGKQCRQNESLFRATANVFATFATSVQILLL